ncbi:hypothetical protein GWI33_005562 [Rhynchophorus ferrugineus]|uniref:Uncharacterized protein n=1 Tax=Rhynchophorus ferrugineus TaxID=354439 RepID=A0A834IMZ8_RHYFE|nr:hypothetical protein GWI33_005562 [Rhynchophorus ferrugineus]
MTDRPLVFECGRWFHATTLRFARSSIIIVRKTDAKRLVIKRGSAPSDDRSAPSSPFSTAPSNLARLKNAPETHPLPGTKHQHRPSRPPPSPPPFSLHVVGIIRAGRRRGPSLREAEGHKRDTRTVKPAGGRRRAAGDRRGFGRSVGRGRRTGRGVGGGSRDDDGRFREVRAEGEAASTAGSVPGFRVTVRVERVEEGVVSSQVSISIGCLSIFIRLSMKLLIMSY